MHVAFAVGIVALWGTAAVLAVPDTISDGTLDESALPPVSEPDDETTASPSDEAVAEALDDDVFIPLEPPAPEVVALPPPLPSPSPPTAFPSPTPATVPLFDPSPSPSQIPESVPEPPPQTIPEEFPPESGDDTQTESPILDQPQSSLGGLDRQSEVDVRQNLEANYQDSNFREDSARLVQNEIAEHGKKSSGTSASGVVLIILLTIVVAGAVGYGGVTFIRRQRLRHQNGWRPFDVEMTERMF